MGNLLIVGGLAYLGATLGSFVGAQVWRLRAQQLIEDDAQGEHVRRAELERLRGLVRPLSRDRSECLSCHHQLAWYDLLPIVSWIALGGKCRYCRAGIGRVELLLELGLAATFVLSYLAWPYGVGSTFGVVSLCLWLIACVVMAILFVYDAKWFLLPFTINSGLVVLAVVYAVYRLVSLGVDAPSIISTLVGIGVMAGLYFIFSLFGWVGLGDSILGVGLALLLGTWELAFLALFLANLLGCVMLVPLAVRGRLHRRAHIPFGPFLVLGTVLAMLWGREIIAFVFTWSDTLLTTLMV